jgi:DME family drug/metabolite transporter
MRQQTYGITGGAGLVLGAALLWGTVGPAQGLAGEVMNPAALGGWRLVVGGAVLALLCRGHLRGLRPALRRGLLRPLLVCALATGVFQAAFLYATARTGAALATVVALGVAPVATGVIARLVTGEALTRTWALSTAAAVLGCALLFVPDGAGRAEVDVLGLLTATASGVCYGLYTVYARRLATDHPGVHLPTVSALALLLGSVPLLPWGWSPGWDWPRPPSPTGSSPSACAPPARPPWAPSASPNPSRRPSSASSSCTSTSRRRRRPAAC